MSANKRQGQVNVVYLGMASDIMAPLLLVPDLDILYALNSLDDAYGTWDEHKERIRKTLTQGNDKNLAEKFLFDESVREYAPKNKEWRNVHTLAGPSEISSDVDCDIKECITGANTHDKFCYTPSVWKLKFVYNGKERQLIYYYNYNFAVYDWPSEIQNIQHFIWNGAYSWESMTEYSEEVKVREMMVERAAPEAYVYALGFNHKKFPDHMWVYNGHNRSGHNVAKMKLNFSDSDWWKKNYQGGKRKTIQTNTRKRKQMRRQKKRRQTRKY